MAMKVAEAPELKEELDLEERGEAKSGNNARPG